MLSWAVVQGGCSFWNIYMLFNIAGKCKLNSKQKSLCVVL